MSTLKFGFRLMLVALVFGCGAIVLRLVDRRHEEASYRERLERLQQLVAQSNDLVTKAREKRYAARQDLDRAKEALAALKKSQEAEGSGSPARTHESATQAQ
jgi:hypothetical protein